MSVIGKAPAVQESSNLGTSLVLALFCLWLCSRVLACSAFGNSAMAEAAKGAHDKIVDVMLAFDAE